ncbi:hypothetical protein KUCAC02_002489 [Chaenocephalus aceratus]|uniref:Uncharacterized protein n=1 Tax=Chaenocephalus aceratus TaxID=36190 RepID=A0ACB9XTU8_CHAAC|nr:hypothetical protein KUCAC02_002489 [Chaenocephalus aceratus]
MKWMFKEDHSLEHRCIESAKIRNKYPDRVPVIGGESVWITDSGHRQEEVPGPPLTSQWLSSCGSSGNASSCPQRRPSSCLWTRQCRSPASRWGSCNEKEKDEDGFFIRGLQWGEHLWLLKSKKTTIWTGLTCSTPPTPHI